MSSGNDWTDAKHMGRAAAGAIVEALSSFSVDEKNVRVIDLTPGRKNAKVGVFRVEVSADDANLPGAAYTVIVT